MIISRWNDVARWYPWIGAELGHDWCQLHAPFLGSINGGQWGCSMTKSWKHGKDWKLEGLWCPGCVYWMVVGLLKMRIRKVALMVLMIWIHYRQSWSPLLYFADDTVEMWWYWRVTRRSSLALIYASWRSSLMMRAYVIILTDSICCIFSCTRVAIPSTPRSCWPSTTSGDQRREAWMTRLVQSVMP